MAKTKSLLPIASAWDVPAFTIMDGNWKELEKTYGVPISNDVRQRFIKVTENYLEWGAFERNAQPISKARKRIKRLIPILMTD